MPKYFIQNGPEEAVELSKKAMDSNDKGRYEEALEYANQSLALPYEESYNKESYNSGYLYPTLINKAESLYSLGQYDKAIKACNSADELNITNYYDSYRFLALSYYEQGNYANVMKTLCQDLTEQSKENFNFYITKGKLLYNLSSLIHKEEADIKKQQENAIDFLKILNLHPENLNSPGSETTIEAYDLLAKLLFKQGKQEEAIACYDKYVGHQDKELFSMKKAQFLYDLGDYKNVLAVLKNINVNARREDKYSSTSLECNILFKLGGTYETVMQELDHNARDGCMHIVCDYIAKLHMFMTNNHNEAIGIYDKAVSTPEYTNKQISEIYFKKAKFLYELRQYEKAVLCYEQVIDRKSDLVAQALLQKGNILSKFGTKQEAIECYKEAIENNSQIIEAYDALARLLNEQKDSNADEKEESGSEDYQDEKTENINYHDEAIKNNPYSLDALFNKGKFLCEKEDYESSKNCFDEAIDRDKKYLKAYDALARLLDKNDKYEDAINEYDKSIKDNLYNEKAYLNKAKFLCEKEDYIGAEACYQKAIDNIPENISDAYLNKAKFLYEQKRYPEAEACYQKAIDSKYNTIDAHNGKGLAFYNEGKYQEALECFNNAIKLDRNHPVAYQYQCRTLLKEQNSEDQGIEQQQEIQAKITDLYKKSHKLITSHTLLDEDKELSKEEEKFVKNSLKTLVPEIETFKDTEDNEIQEILSFYKNTEFSNDDDILHRGSLARRSKEKSIDSSTSHTSAIPSSDSDEHVDISDSSDEEDQNNDLENQISRLKAKVHNNKENINKLCFTKSRFNKDFRDFATKVKTLDKKDSKLESEISKLKNDNTQLKSAVFELSSKFSELTEQFAKVTAQKDCDTQKDGLKTEAETSDAVAESHTVALLMSEVDRGGHIADLPSHFDSDCAGVIVETEDHSF